MILLYIVVIVYIIAVNFYAVLLMKAQRDEEGGSDEKPHKGDGKIILTALMGGAIGIYASMFAMRYRLKNLPFMILMPVIAVLNVYLFDVAFKSGFTFLIAG